MRERGATFPVIGVWIDNHAVYGCGCIVAFLSSRTTSVVSGNDNAAAVGVQQKLLGIESYSLGWIEGSMDAIGIDLPRLSLWNEYVPIVVRSVSDGIDIDDSRRLSVIFPLKKQQLDA